MKNNKEMCPVVHFEMGYNDKDRMIKFYEGVFGWAPERLGPEMGNYVTVATGETDKNRMPKKPGFINGGFYQKTENTLSHAPSVVIAVKDIHAKLEEVKAAGGTILGAMGEGGERVMTPQQIPGVGLWISAQDPEGNRFSILQPDRM